MVKRFGWLIIASFIIMAIGILLFLLTPVLYGNYGLDTDIIGLNVFTTGLAICIIGIIRRKKPHGWKLVVLIILAVLLLLLLIPLIVSTIYFLITGQSLGW
jgi:hypothetical protein